MDKIDAPTKIQNPVYQVEFEYTSPSEQTKTVGNYKGSKKDSERQKQLRGNFISVGEPIRINLKQLIVGNGSKIPNELEILWDQFDFWYIKSPFSFTAAHGSKFDRARILTILEGLSDDLQCPIAYDVFPKNIFKEITEDKEIHLGLNFKFTTIIGAKVNYIQKIESSKLKSSITAAGIGQSQPSWSFYGEAAFYLTDINYLEMIVKVPINSAGIRLTHYADAKVKTGKGIFSITTRLNGKHSYEILFQDSPKGN